jgi:hypothetical protein
LSRDLQHRPRLAVPGMMFTGRRLFLTSNADSATPGCA